MKVELLHIAGLPAILGTRMRQRCAWCGAVLFDFDKSGFDASMMPAPFIAGHWIAVIPTDNGPFVRPAQELIDADAPRCTHLDPAVTL